MTNLVFTLLYGIGYKYAYDALPSTYQSFLPDVGTTNLYTCFNGMYTSLYDYFSAGTLINCRDFGFYLGQCVAETLSAKTESTVALVEVQTFA